MTQATVTGTERPIPDTIITLAKDRLYGLAHPFELDGRPVSTHPRGTQGYGQFNCYLVIEGDEALLIDTGMPAHEELVLSQLDHLLDPTTTLSLIALRGSDFASVSNSRAIAERFNIGDVMISSRIPTEEVPGWLDFGGSWRDPTGGGALAKSGRRSLVGKREIIVKEETGSASGRVLEILRPKLMFIPTQWLYDVATRTLFTSDMFTYVWRAGDTGPWVVDDEEDIPPVEHVGDYLIGTRFWWLAGADTAPIREDLAAIWKDREIDCLGPAFGCVLRGKSVVERHLALLDQALVELGEREPLDPMLVPYYEESR
jgi:hypothetical protein